MVAAVNDASAPHEAVHMVYHHDGTGQRLIAPMSMSASPERVDRSSQSQVDQAVHPFGDPQPLVPHGWLRALLCVMVR